MKLDLLAIGAHPDDVELSCAGTLIKEATKGKRVGVIDLTQGELGTRGNAETRAEEAKKAAEIMGLAIRKNLKFRDGFFKNDEAHQLEIIKLIRKYQPEIVFCNAIHDRHIDHSKGSQLVSDACFLSGLRKIETTHEDKIQEVWRPKHVYHYIQWYDITPDVVVDISGFISKKVEAVKAYKTQFFDPTNSEPKTPISSQNFLDSVTYRARDLGRIIGVDHAEGFTVERYAAVDSIFDLI
ncbi:bacillithiol biosynthesis deacetylase BshB1 [Psychroflexus sp. ALD_RP9]|uniref:bacillithiol biosynthesis deacetylase BshB1 n=1 Tax=Psychroflexus sp. ALD_RP9 TaxID=2777186 RepID=UPI001A8E7B6D|nr:bacillithiol biosynthesis deacetylase BshB1 [Psychroflexus sp. ALD_RP9]QSS97195.1 bacillithiol biosynthesis deacetylase BshB1 [Psychroflexus sp. ALD_RP9]